LVSGVGTLDPWFGLEAQPESLPWHRGRLCGGLARRAT